MDWKLAMAVGLVVLLGLGMWWLWPSDGHEAHGPFEFLGAYEIPTAEWRYGEMVVGGISGLAYDAGRGLYYAVSDSRGEQGTPGKLFALAIEVSEDGIAAVSVRDVLLLDRIASMPGAQPYGPDEIDAEEVLLDPHGNLIISSERDSENRPWIRRFSSDGEWIGGVALPQQFAVDSEHGVRANLGIEGMAVAEGGAVLYAANEQALVQDGPLATVEEGTRVRLLRFSLAEQTPSAVAQYVYETEPIFAAPVKGGFADNGVAAMLDAAAIDPAYDLIVMERAYAEGVGNHIALFGLTIGEATDVGDLDALGPPSTFVPVGKTLLLTLSADPRLSDLDIAPDNMEAMCLGPHLEDGERVLLLASDNNFNASQRNLFLAFAVEDDR